MVGLDYAISTGYNKDVLSLTTSTFISLQKDNVSTMFHGLLQVIGRSDGNTRLFYIWTTPKEISHSDTPSSLSESYVSR